MTFGNGQTWTLAQRSTREAPLMGDWDVVSTTPAQGARPAGEWTLSRRLRRASACPAVAGPPLALDPQRLRRHLAPEITALPA